MLPEEIKTEVLEKKLVPFYKLESYSSIINFLNNFNQIKYYQVTSDGKKYIIYITMKWYYIWPFGYFFIKNLQRQVNLLKSKHVIIDIEHKSWWQK